MGTITIQGSQKAIQITVRDKSVSILTKRPFISVGGTFNQFGTGLTLTPEERDAWLGHWVGTAAEQALIPIEQRLSRAQWLAGGIGWWFFMIITESGIVTATLIKSNGVVSSIPIDVLYPIVASLIKSDGIVSSVTLNALLPVIAQLIKSEGSVNSILVEPFYGVVAQLIASQSLVSSTLIEPNYPVVAQLIASQGTVSAILLELLYPGSAVEAPLIVSVGTVDSILIEPNYPVEATLLKSEGIVSSMLVNPSYSVVATLLKSLGTVSSTLINPIHSPTISITSGTALQVVLDWADVSGATGYDVYRHSATFTPPSTGTKVGDNISPSTFTELTTAGAYYYRVIAKNAGGSSLPSNEIDVTTSGGAALGPLAPNNPSFEANNALASGAGYTDNAWSKYISTGGDDPAAIATVTNVAISGQDATDLNGSRAIQMTVASGWGGTSQPGVAQLKYRFTGLDGTKSKLNFTVKQKTAWNGHRLGLRFLAFDGAIGRYRNNVDSNIFYTAFFTAGADESVHECTIDLDAIKVNLGGATGWGDIDTLDIDLEFRTDTYDETPATILVDDFRAVL